MSKKKNSGKKYPKNQNRNPVLRDQVSEVEELVLEELTDDTVRPADALTDDTIVIAPVDIEKPAEAVAEVPDSVDSESAADTAAVDAEAASVEISAEKAPAEEVPMAEVPAEETPMTDVPAEEAPMTDVPVIEAHEDNPPADEIPAKEGLAENVPAEEVPAFEGQPAGKNPVTGKLRGLFAKHADNSADKPAGDSVNKAFDKPVSRKLLAAALAAALVLNGAITAGIMALYTSSIKDDISDVEKAVSEISTDRTDGYGGSDPGREMNPPDWGSDDDWGNGYGWGSGDDWDSDDDWGGGYYDYYDDDSDYDDWDDDDQGSSSQVSIGILINDNNGVYISQVTGNNAKKAGFKEGDKIVSFDGVEIKDANSLISEVRSHKAGDKVKVIVERNGKQVKIKTTLE